MFLKFINIRKFVKKIGKFTKNFPPLHRLIANTFNFYIIYILPIFSLYKKFDLKKTKDISKILGLQSIRLIKLNNIDLTNRDTLKKSFKKIDFKEGGWCVYHKNAFDILDKKLFIESYRNKSIGLKILINDKEIASDKNNTSYGLRPFGRYSNVKEILRVGNRMFLLNIGPKIYDLIRLEDKNGIRCYAYLISNIESKDVEIPKKDYARFLNFLEVEKWLEPTWTTTFLIDDFDTKKKSSNLVLNMRGETKFLDFQAFAIPKENEYINQIVEDFGVTAFGEKRLFSNSNFLYQVLPEVNDGKRDTLKRWKEFDKMFNKINLSINNKNILDVGCNIGMNCYYALSRGASFVYGIDKKEISNRANHLLNSLGATRYEILGLDLNYSKDLNKISELLENKIDFVFYCSIDGHIGYPNQIRDIPFKYILHEGHPNTSLEENINNLLINNWLNTNSSNILFKEYISDGDSPSRPLILASR